MLKPFFSGVSRAHTPLAAEGGELFVDQEGENDGDEQGGWKVGRQIGRPSRLSSTVVAAATRKRLSISISINVTVTLCVQCHPETTKSQRPAAL